MIKNYFKTAWRNIIKHRFFSLLNIIGLFTGMAFCFLIAAFTWQEWRVNKDLRNAKNQFILTTVSKDPNIGFELASFGPIAKRLKDDYPGLVKNYYRWDGITSVVSKNDKHFRENLQVGDSTILSMYGFTLKHGDARTALLKPFSVIISQDKAIKYFGKTDVVGETVSIQSFSGQNDHFTIMGVLDKVNRNSVMNLLGNDPNSIFIPVNTLSYFGREPLDSWNNMFIASFIELNEGVQIKDLEKPIARLVQQNANETLKKIITVKPVLLSQFYLNKDNALIKRMLYTLGLVAAFILLMAVLNFVNIALSGSASRNREIGVRKVMGAVKNQLIFQFIAESVILSVIATLLALGAYQFLKPVFEQLVGRQIPALNSFPVWYASIPCAAALFIGLLAGFYPAFVLSSLTPVASLKAKIKNNGQKIFLRKILVGTQFGLALMVIIAAFIVSKQVSHFFGKSLGYNREFIVTAQAPRDWTADGVKRMLTLRNEFAKLPQVSQVSLSFEIPDGNNGGQVPIYRLGADSAAASFMQQLRIDDNYLNTYQVSLLAGNFFNEAGSDSGKLVMNEKAIAILGFKNAAEAVGKQVRVPGDATVFTIAGVVKNFQIGSMQQAMPPVAFFNVRFDPVYRYLSFKLKPGNVPASIEAIQKKWAALLPGSSFEYSFMDQTLEKLYSNEIRLKKAAYTATVLSFIVVLLGVLGLVSLSVHQRIKEIGIRKVLGASIPTIITLFAKEFFYILVAAALIAFPAAYYLMSKWLNDYAERISISAAPFAFSLLILTLLAFLLIIFQTWKAARANPVKSLRTE
ncbi:MAG: FtsX-like permease family protein [Ferruginibacter sp.]